MIDAEDLLHRLTGGDVVRVPCRQHHGAGEYDGLAQIDRRTLRMLRGGGWLSRNGCPLDVMAWMVNMSCDHFLDEYVRLIKLANIERRQAKNRRVYRRRDQRARAAGYSSFWHQRSTRARELERAA